MDPGARWAGAGIARDRGRELNPHGGSPCWRNPHLGEATWRQRIEGVVSLRNVIGSRLGSSPRCLATGALPAARGME
jgi:hypothetical protein